MEILICVVLAGVGGFVGGVIGSVHVHNVETRLRAELVAVETRLRSSFENLAKKI